MTKIQDLTNLSGGRLPKGTRLRCKDEGSRNLIYFVDSVLPAGPNHLERYLLLGEEGGSDIVATKYVEERYTLVKK